MSRRKYVRTTLAATSLLLIAPACGDDGQTSNPPANEVDEQSSSPTSGDAEIGTCDGGFSPPLFAVDRSSGSVSWTFCPEEPASVDIAWASDDVVYVFSWSESSASDLVAIGAADGAERWRVPVASHERGAGPFTAAETIVVEGAADAAGHLVGLSAATGDEQWRVPVGQFVGPFANTESAVVISDRPTPPGPPFAQGLDRTTGEQRWQSTVLMQGSVAAIGDTVVISDSSSTVAIDASSGRELWSAGNVFSPFATNQVLLGQAVPDARMQEAQALDITNGATRWSVPGRPSYGGVWAVGDGAVFVVDGQEIVGYELADGAERWRLPMPPSQHPIPISEPMAADDDHVYVGWEVFVAAWSTADGAPRWEVRPELVEPAWITGVATNDALAFVSLSDFAPTD